MRIKYLKSINKKAITIIELVFVLLILGIIYKVGPEFFRNLLDSTAYTSTRISLTRDARIAVEEMKRFIMQASSPTALSGSATDYVEKIDGVKYNFLNIGYVEHQQDGNTIKQEGSSIEFWIDHSKKFQYFLKCGFLYRCSGGSNYTKLTGEGVYIKFDNDSRKYLLDFDWKDPQGNTSSHWIRIRVTFCIPGPKTHKEGNNIIYDERTMSISLEEFVYLKNFEKPEVEEFYAKNIGSWFNPRTPKSRDFEHDDCGAPDCGSGSGGGCGC